MIASLIFIHIILICLIIKLRNISVHCFVRVQISSIISLVKFGLDNARKISIIKMVIDQIQLKIMEESQLDREIEIKLRRLREYLQH